MGGQSYRQCLAEIIQKHGRVGLYKGLTSGMVGSASPGASESHFVSDGKAVMLSGLQHSNLQRCESVMLHRRTPAPACPSAFATKEGAPCESMGGFHPCADE